VIFHSPAVEIDFIARRGNMAPSQRTPGKVMKRKYGSALSRESEAEKAQRLRAKEMGSNVHNYGSVSRKGAISRGKKRGKAYRAGA